MSSRGSRLGAAVGHFTGMRVWLNAARWLPKSLHMPSSAMAVSYPAIWETTAFLEDGMPEETHEYVRSFTIVTTPPNKLFGELHNRVPVILPPRGMAGMAGCSRGTSAYLAHSVGQPAEFGQPN